MVTRLENVTNFWYVIWDIPVRESPFRILCRLPLRGAVGGAAGGSEVGLAVPLSTSSTLVIFLEGFTVPVILCFLVRNMRLLALRRAMVDISDLISLRSCKIKQQVTASYPFKYTECQKKHHFFRATLTKIHCMKINHI